MQKGTQEGAFLGGAALSLSIPIYISLAGTAPWGVSVSHSARDSARNPLLVQGHPELESGNCPHTRLLLRGKDERGRANSTRYARRETGVRTSPFPRLQGQALAKPLRGEGYMVAVMVLLNVSLSGRPTRAGSLGSRDPTQPENR